MVPALPQCLILWRGMPEGRLAKAQTHEHQHGLKLAQEAHGDEGALIANRQSQWLTLVNPLLYSLMATLLDEKNDTRIIVLTTKRLEKRPYFKAQHCTLVPVDAIALEIPQMTSSVQDAMHTLKMSHHQANYAYGLIVITCSNDLMVPVVCNPLFSPDIELPHINVDIILCMMNEEPIT